MAVIGDTFECSNIKGVPGMQKHTGQVFLVKALRTPPGHAFTGEFRQQFFPRNSIDCECIRKTTLHLLSLHHLNSVEISLESLWHLKVQPRLHFKLKVKFKRGFESFRSVSHKCSVLQASSLGFSKGVAECGKETNTRFFFFRGLLDTPHPLPS